MKELLQKRLSDSKAARWTALLVVSFTMMCGYFMTDVMSPLENMLTAQDKIVYFTDGESCSSDSLKTMLQEASQMDLSANRGIDISSLQKGNKVQIVQKKNNTVSAAPTEKTLVEKEVDSVIEGSKWTSKEYGIFSGAYGYINVFLLMLFFGGIILDKMGIRFTGVMSSSLMLAGAAIKWFAISTDFGDAEMFGIRMQVVMASLGFAIFGLGAEITGITISKIIVKWFAGKEMALAMGLQVAMARIGTALALAASLPLARTMQSVTAPIWFGAIALAVGLIFYLVYCVMDKKEDASAKAVKEAATGQTDEEEKFKISDLKLILKNKGFWLITLLCLMFYSGVFPFLKFATKVMIYKYDVPESFAGIIPALLPFGTILLTPIFGSLYDRIGKGATLMIIGSVMLTIVHVLFALPILNYWWFAVAVMVVLGIAFSLVPSAMWPSVPKIIPMKQLGSAYATIFYIQNIGLSMVPVLIGWVIDKYATIRNAANKITGYDYTAPLVIFAAFGICAILISLLLKAEDGKKHYGLEEPNIKK